MKKLVTTPLTNTIWYATVNEENGTMNTSTRVDVTDSAIDAVFYHLINFDLFKENGFMGYEIDKADKSGSATICVFDNNKHVCVSKEIYKELLEYKRKYEDLCK